MRAQLSGLLDRLNAPEVLRWELDSAGAWHHRPDADGVDVQTDLLRSAREAVPVA